MPPQQFNALKRRNGGLFVQYRPAIVATLTVISIFAFFRFVVLASDPVCPEKGSRYGIMFDAGSTGSRIHVFEFNFENQDIKLLREVFEQIKPGLSSYAANPEEAGKSLVPLLDIAMKEVPAHLRSCTPMLLKATAGLRLIGEAKSNRILAVVRGLFARYPFKVPSHGVEVMDGDPLGWDWRLSL